MALDFAVSEIDMRSTSSRVRKLGRLPRRLVSHPAKTFSAISSVIKMPLPAAWGFAGAIWPSVVEREGIIFQWVSMCQYPMEKYSAKIQPTGNVPGSLELADG